MYLTIIRLCFALYADDDHTGEPLALACSTRRCCVAVIGRIWP
jgi:hypothetical protein